MGRRLIQFPVSRDETARLWYSRDGASSFTSGTFLEGDPSPLQDNVEYLFPWRKQSMSPQPCPRTHRLLEEGVSLFSVQLCGSCKGVHVLVKASRKYRMVLGSHSIFSGCLEAWENVVNCLDFRSGYGADCVILWCCLRPRFIPSCLCAGLSSSAWLLCWQYGCHRAKACTSLSGIYRRRESEIVFSLFYILLEKTPLADLPSLLPTRYYWWLSHIYRP